MKHRKLSILIVDDNDMMRAILRSMLRGDDYEVVGEARNGSQAIELADRLHPEIICMDVMMPEKNGLEALHEIKAARPETAIVMITGNAEPETVQDAIMNGAQGFIIKPFNAAKILDTLHGVALKLRQRS